MGTGQWYGHECSGGTNRMLAHKWQERWCHLEHPGAKPRLDACGKCPIHCECPSKRKVLVPQPAEGEDVKAFVTRLARSGRSIWSPHKSE